MTDADIDTGKLPPWATLIQEVVLKDNLLHGTVSNEAQLQHLLEIHGRATLSDHIGRLILWFTTIIKLF